MAQPLSAVDDDDALFRQNPWQSNSEDGEDEILTEEEDDVSEESFLVEGVRKKTGGIRSRWQVFTGKFRNRRGCVCIHATKQFRGVRVVFDFIKMIYYIVVSRWLNALIVFVPIGMATFFLRSNPAIIFITNALAIVPLSALLTEATERIAEHAGETIGALLNISLGNLVELILLVALANGHVRIVKASILGSVLVNLLLILGTALLACSISGIESSYDISGTEVFGCLLFVSVFTFMMPTAFDLTFGGAQHSEGATLKLSRVSAFLVLAIYVVYVIYELTSTSSGHDVSTDIRNDVESQSLSFHEQQTATPRPNTVPLPLPPRTIRFAEEEQGNPNPKLRDDAAEEFGDEADAGMSYEANLNELRGRLSAEGFKGSVSGLTYQRFPRIRDQSRSLSLVSSRAGRSRDSSVNSSRPRFLMTSALPSLRVMRSRSMEDYRQAHLDHGSSSADAGVEMVVSVFLLVLSSALMSMNAEFLVSTIDEVTHNGHLSESLIGLIILPIVGNVAEYITVVSVAMKEKLDLAVAVSLGSSIQIALCVTPLTVIAGWVLDKDLDLSFNFFEIATLIGSVLVVNLIVMSEGGGGLRANALHGALMCGCYAIIGMGAYMAPES